MKYSWSLWVRQTVGSTLSETVGKCHSQTRAGLSSTSVTVKRSSSFRLTGGSCQLSDPQPSVHFEQRFFFLSIGWYPIDTGGKHENVTVPRTAFTAQGERG